MKYIRQRVLSRELLAGTWCNLGSPLTAEIAGASGFDWVLLDTEHGAGDHESLLGQLQALESTPAAPIVRIAWNEPPRFKRVLDLGCSGVMVPYVNSREEARAAVAAMRYPPGGVRGVASFHRANRFGWEFDDYFARANDGLLTVVQIETAEAVANIEAIAAVEGVDVLFIGPLDLSTNLGVPRQFDHPHFRECVRAVNAAARAADKAAGILLARPEQVPRAVADGFTFVALASDGSILAAGMKAAAAALKAARPV